MGFAALALAACGKPSDQTSAPPAAEANGAASITAQAAVASTASDGLVVAAPTDVKPAQVGIVAPPNPHAAADAVADNAKMAELAKQFEADPAAIARQSAACGPANQIVTNLYAMRHGVQTEELRRFRMACMAKDDAQREVAKRAAAAGGGVKNTNSL
ncbi:MAG TPA: hypothetical protein VL358_09625 [Caulobacteraceae bacterium]|nr:hypothetical protein [Caulobacteraceae bacterium]